MALLRSILFLSALTLATNAFAERQIVEIYQPTSLLGTEGEDDPLHNGQSMPATILQRPVVVGGAFPESPVAAVALPHTIAGASQGFPKESNLIVLVGGKLHAEWGEKQHTIIADFSQAKASDDLGVTLLQVMQLTAECLQLTLKGWEKTPIDIVWKTPEGSESLVNTLPKGIKR